MPMLLRHLTEGVVITDAELRVITVNDAFGTITGHQAVETTGRPIRDFFASDYPESLMEDIHANRRSARAHGKANYRAAAATANRFRRSSVSARFATKPAAPEHYTAVFTDLTTFREFEQRIEYVCLCMMRWTGLPNRSALEDHVRSAIAYAESMSSHATLLIVELGSLHDRERYARPPGYGDLLLKAVAQRIDQTRKADSLLARMGGDEFMLFSL